MYHNFFNKVYIFATKFKKNQYKRVVKFLGMNNCNAIMTVTTDF